MSMYWVHLFILYIWLIIGFKVCAWSATSGVFSMLLIPVFQKLPLSWIKMGSIYASSLFGSLALTCLMAKNKGFILGASPFACGLSVFGLQQVLQTYDDTRNYTYLAILFFLVNYVAMMFSVDRAINDIEENDEPDVMSHALELSANTIVTFLGTLVVVGGKLLKRAFRRKRRK